MDSHEFINNTSLCVLGALVIFQSLHYFIGALSFWKTHPRRVVYTAAVMSYWIIHGVYFLTYVATLDSYIQAAPFVVLALNLPPILIITGIIFSDRVRNTVDRVSLRWAIQSVEGPARIIAGTILMDP